MFVEETLVFPTEIEKLKELFSDMIFDAAGYISKTYSVGIYAPNDKAEFIIFVNPGYYE